MLTYDSNAFARVVIREMETTGITYKELAAILGKSPSTVWDQLSGRRRIQMATLRGYAKALGLSVKKFADMIRREEERS